ncbi:RHS repeat protein [Prevotella sp. E13-17]|uniref:RHS repeat domain-containing protein n=1 Tax=Prevotella sp. E13-17 TaxID=2913616 RepID=UPI001EDBEC0E|nr:RHS repeat domain-containing protein [Prevotella sp. E13-17]UKK50762.1 RHS repeat protein [Prevotella sp. E13-17]
MKRIYLLLSIVFVMSHLWGQNRIPGDIPSPNASDLGRFGTVPVSYYTGRPNISIPLYELKVRDVTLPITMQYEPSGVLLNSLPGWTGYNWTLNATGVITRQVQGRYDEYVYPKGSLAYPVSNYFHTYGRLKDILEKEGKDEYHRNLRDSIFRGYSDFAPDIFYFNFLGISGRFFLGSDGQWNVSCDRNIEVIFDVEDQDNYARPFIDKYPSSNLQTYQPETIKGFVLRDENGTEYHFGGDSSYIEYNVPFFHMSSKEDFIPWTANSWYLKKIVDRMGNELFSFSYERGKFIAQFFYSARCFTYSSNAKLGAPWLFGSINDSQSSFYSQFESSGDLISPIYLKSIKAMDGRTVRFVSSFLSDDYMDSLYIPVYSVLHSYMTKWQQEYNNINNLNLPFYYLQTEDGGIKMYQYRGYEVENYNNPLLRTRLKQLDAVSISLGSGDTGGHLVYRFDYDFNSRMHLNGIKIMDDRYFYDSANALYGEYRFLYDNYDKLPADFLTKAVDHWGYYRGVAYKLPTNDEEFENFYNQRTPSAIYTRYGSMTDIIYPTGGHTKLEYEQNDYMKYMSDNRQETVTLSTPEMAGGLRIKRITEYEDSTDVHILQQRTFSYNDPSTGKSSGELFAKPKYYWPNMVLRQSASDNPSTTLTEFRTTSIVPLSNSFGPSLGYSCVTETFGDGTKHVYRYSNISAAHDLLPDPVSPHNTASIYDEYSERGFYRGHLLSEEIYDGSNKLCKKTDYKYRSDKIENRYVLTSNIGWQTFGNSTAFNFYYGGIYKLFYPKYDVIREITTTYDGDSPLVETHEYSRSDWTLNVQHGVKTSKVDIRRTIGEEVKRKNDTHYIDYLYAYNSTDSLTKELSSKQFFLAPIGIRIFRNGGIMYKRQTVFDRFNGKEKQILPKYELEYKDVFNPDTIVSYLAYTPTGMLQQYQETGKPVVTLSWIANDSWLLAKAVGNPSKNPSVDDQRQFDKDYLLQYFKNYRTTTNQHVTSYTYSSSGLMTSETDPNGFTLLYDYDRLGRLIGIKDGNGLQLKRFEYNYRK